MARNRIYVRVSEEEFEDIARAARVAGISGVDGQGVRVELVRVCGGGDEGLWPGVREGAGDEREPAAMSQDDKRDTLKCAWCSMSIGERHGGDCLYPGDVVKRWQTR